MLQKVKKGLVDKIGGILALTCAIHCLMLPILLSFGTVFAHGTVEFFFVISAIIFTALTLFQSQRHGTLEASTVFIFGAAILLLFFSLIFHLHFLSAVGGVLLTIGHVQQLRRGATVRVTS